MRTFFVFFMCACFATSFAQTKELRKLSEAARKSYLEQISKEVMTLLGPDYLQNNSKFMVSKPIEYSAFDDRMAGCNGRRYYSVSVSYYDKEVSKDTLHTVVNVWEETGEAESVMFPCNIGLIFHDIAPSFQEVKKKGKDVKFKAVPKKRTPGMRD